jgi:hypothetical protein
MLDMSFKVHNLDLQVRCLLLQHPIEGYQFHVLLALDPITFDEGGRFNQ